jgi:hypothetical protein
VVSSEKKTLGNKKFTYVILKIELFNLFIIQVIFGELKRFCLKHFLPSFNFSLPQLGRRNGDLCVLEPKGKNPIFFQKTDFLWPNSVSRKKLKGKHVCTSYKSKNQKENF